MLKSRSKSFAPKKIIRNAPRNQPGDAETPTIQTPNTQDFHEEPSPSETITKQSEKSQPDCQQIETIVQSNSSILPDHALIPQISAPITHHSQNLPSVSSQNTLVDDVQVASESARTEATIKKKNDNLTPQSSSSNNSPVETYSYASTISEPSNTRKALRRRPNSPKNSRSSNAKKNSNNCSLDTLNTSVSSSSKGANIIPASRDERNLENVINDRNGASESSTEAPVQVPVANLPGKIESTSKQKRKYTKRNRAGKDLVANDVSLNDSSKPESTKKTGGRRGRKREETPEGAETKKIDPTVITMQDLCRDLRIGKKSKNHDHIMGRLSQVKRNAIKAKMLRDHPELAEMIPEEGDCISVPEQDEGTDISINSKLTPPPEPSSGPRMRIVDGQIVTDEQSLQIDRHKRARENNNLEENIVEENDFTRVVNCHDYMKRQRSQHWDLQANELFWKGLRMFGTDFEMIAKMFPHRSRRQIKLKFNAEERCNPQTVNRVLMGIKTEAIDLDEFQRLGNLELEDLAVIKAEEARVEKEQSDQLEAVEQAKLAEIKRRRAEIHGVNGAKRFLDNISDDENEALNEDTKSRKNGVKAKKSRKNIQSVYGGGEEVIVLKTIE